MKLHLGSMVVGWYVFNTRSDDCANYCSDDCANYCGDDCANDCGDDCANDNESGRHIPLFYFYQVIFIYYVQGVPQKSDLLKFFSTLSIQLSFSY